MSDILPGGGQAPFDDGDPSPDALAAHDFLSELRTRIATQPLPYQHGVEESALLSLRDLFAAARKTMKDHPRCGHFARAATDILNTEVRPVTAKWHRALKDGSLSSRDGANEFRADLRRLQSRLAAFAESLQVMAYGSAKTDAPTPPVMRATDIAQCFNPLEFGLDVGGPGEEDEVLQGVNADERREVLARRKAYDISEGDPEKPTNAIGLALSGGGIRSATFCLGVVQTLSDRGLLRCFDFMSTVSGGGYTGSFISSLVGAGAPFRDIGASAGPDTDAIRHVRQNAKFLRAADVKRRWMLIAGTLAGMVLNWTGPVFALCLLSMLTVSLHSWITPDLWWLFAIVFGFGAAVMTMIYGFSVRFVRTARWALGVLAAFAALTVAFSLLYALELGFKAFAASLQAHWQVSSSVVLTILASPAIARFLPAFRSERVRRLAMTAALYSAGLIVPVLAVVAFYLLRVLGGAAADSAVPVYNPLHYISGWQALWALTAVTGLLSLLFVDINLTGPHKLYRDQLADTFIWRKSASEPLLIKELNGSGLAPYHLINAAVNLPSSGSRVLRDRKADFFLLTKHWMGSAAVGYRKTADWRAGPCRQMDLATAMAISGAAASPHMGLATKPTLSALMTLLNLRLGFWIPRPPGCSLFPPGFLCLMREMTGFGMSEKSSWLNLSDGGHIENMGIYELLRRRCKLIVAVDGEADPESTFAGHLTLVRHAQIDLGVRIEPRLDEMRPDPKSRFSRAHGQLFRITYPETRDGRPAGGGLLLYLKLSLTGNEAELLKRYRALHPDFPHQSTLDQFYDEEQFEVYRQLGVHVAQGMFAPALLADEADPGGVAPIQDIEHWFRRLAGNMLEPVLD